MTGVPLGAGAFERSYAQEPEIQLINRFLERAPTNPIEQTTLLSRPGSSFLVGAGDGPIRMIKTQAGAFNGDLFFVSGESLFRYDGITVLPIGGTVALGGNPKADFVVGAATATESAYEHMFIADGLLLQVYRGLSKAKGTLTATGDALDGDTVTVDAAVYAWTNGSVDAGTPLGTVGDPFLLKLSALGVATGAYTIIGGDIFDGETLTIGSTTYTAQDILVDVANNFLRGATNIETAENFKAAVNLEPGEGTIYGTGTVQNPDAFISDIEFDPGVQIVINATARVGGTAGNSVVTTETTAFGAWGGATLSGGFNVGTSSADALANLKNALNLEGIAGVDYSSATQINANIGGFSSDDTTLVVEARVAGTAGNSLATTETMTNASWAAATLEGGGVHQLDGVLTPDDVAMKTVVTLASHVIAVVANSSRFYWILPGAITIDALDFATAESEPDQIIDAVRVGDSIYIVCQSSTEVWYANPNATVTTSRFLRQQGLAFSQGGLEGTIVPIRTQLIVVAEDGVTYQIAGGPRRISNNGIEERIRLGITADV